MVNSQQGGRVLGSLWVLWHFWEDALITPLIELGPCVLLLPYSYLPSTLVQHCCRAFQVCIHMQKWFTLQANSGSSAVNHFASA